MRVTTNMIFDKGLQQMQKQTSNLLQTQQQVSTGKRVLTPADDPIAAARSVSVNSAKAINEQFMTNQGNAGDKLRMLENSLTGAGDVLQYAHERAVQAGNATLSDGDRADMASDLRAQYDALLGIANTRDGSGEYLFSGYKAETQPFEGDLGGVNYQGDQGSRTIQVSASRYMPTSVPGTEVFDKTLTLSADAVNVVEGRHNEGGAAVSMTADSAQPPAGVRYEIRFEGNDLATADGNDFTVIRREPGAGDVEIDTNVAFDENNRTLSFDDGNIAGIEFGFDGEPAEGDGFEVFSASSNVFDNMALFIDVLERPGAAGVTQGGVSFALDTFDAGMEKVLRTRTQVGSQLKELDNLDKLGSDLDIQYSDTLSRLNDVDWAEAISRLTRQQTFLEASQRSYMQVTGMSLFNYLS